MILDLYYTYQFIRRLSTPFNKWKAYDTGVINDKGDILVDKHHRTPEQQKSFGVFDLLILKLKKLLMKVPGGSTQFATYMAALWLIKEHKMFTDQQTLSENVPEARIDQTLQPFLEWYLYHTKNLKEDNGLFVEDGMSAGAGAIAGIGVGPQGEPGLTLDQQKKHRRRAAETSPRRIVASTVGEAVELGDEIVGQPRRARYRAYVRRVRHHPKPSVKLT